MAVAQRDPVLGLQRNQESKRERYLENGELQRLTEVLAAHEDKQAVDIVRMLLLCWRAALRSFRDAVGES